MAKSRAGWERILYKDAAGATAATIVDHVVDCDVNKNAVRTETTDRGDGTAVPIETHQVVARQCEVTFTMRYYDSDAKIADLIAAAETGEDRAIKVVRRSGGLTEVDADMNLSYTSPGKLKDGMLVEFTAQLSQDSGRAPVIVSA